jgi:hypothetical protein
MALTGFDMSLLSKKYDAMMKSADADMIRAMNSGGSSSGSGLSSDPNAGLQQELLQAQIKQALAGANATNTNASNAEDAGLMQKKLFDQTYNFDGPTRGQLEADALADAELAKEAAKRKKEGLGLKKGITKVPGKGSGKVDKVKATLAPGEAVLNKAAAEHLGRGVITALNALGRQKMGMV